MPISGKPEIDGRPILRDGRYAMFVRAESIRWRPPQDEADKSSASATLIDI
jgi:hypothetical protein